MSVRFNAPPGWPVPSAGWAPDDDWMPDPAWPAAPEGWTFWNVTDHRAYAASRGALVPGPRPVVGSHDSRGYGSDRATWLTRLRETATSAPAVEALSRVGGRRPVVDAWELDGLLTSAGRLDI